MHVEGLYMVEMMILLTMEYMAGVMAVFIAIQCRIRMSTISLNRELKSS